MSPTQAPYGLWKSPITATVHERSPRRCFSQEIPSAHARDYEAWDDSTTSCGDSARLG